MSNYLYRTAHVQPNDTNGFGRSRRDHTIEHRKDKYKTQLKVTKNIFNDENVQIQTNERVSHEEEEVINRDRDDARRVSFDNVSYKIYFQDSPVNTLNAVESKKILESPRKKERISELSNSYLNTKRTKNHVLRNKAPTSVPNFKDGHMEYLSEYNITASSLSDSSLTSNRILDTKQKSKKNTISKLFEDLQNELYSSDSENGDYENKQKYISLRNNQPCYFHQWFLENSQSLTNKNFKTLEYSPVLNTNNSASLNLVPHMNMRLEKRNRFCSGKYDNSAQTLCKPKKIPSEKTTKSSQERIVHSPKRKKNLIKHLLCCIRQQNSKKSSNETSDTCMEDFESSEPSEISKSKQNTPEMIHHKSEDGEYSLTDEERKKIEFHKNPHFTENLKNSISMLSLLNKSKSDTRNQVTSEEIKCGDNSVTMKNYNFPLISETDKALNEKLEVLPVNHLQCTVDFYSSSLAEISCDVARKNSTSVENEMCLIEADSIGEKSFVENPSNNQICRLFLQNATHKSSQRKLLKSLESKVSISSDSSSSYLVDISLHDIEESQIEEFIETAKKVHSDNSIQNRSTCTELFSNELGNHEVRNRGHLNNLEVAIQTSEILDVEQSNKENKLEGEIIQAVIDNQTLYEALNEVKELREQLIKYSTSSQALVNESQQTSGHNMCVSTKNEERRPMVESYSQTSHEDMNCAINKISREVQVDSKIVEDLSSCVETCDLRTTSSNKNPENACQLKSLEDHVYWIWKPVDKRACNFQSWPLNAVFTKCNTLASLPNRQSTRASTTSKTKPSHFSSRVYNARQLKRLECPKNAVMSTKRKTTKSKTSIGANRGTRRKSVNDANRKVSLVTALDVNPETNSKNYKNCLSSFSSDKTVLHTFPSKFSLLKNEQKSDQISFTETVKIDPFCNTDARVLQPLIPQKEVSEDCIISYMRKKHSKLSNSCSSFSLPAHFFSLSSGDVLKTLSNIQIGELASSDLESSPGKLDVHEERGEKETMETQSDIQIEKGKHGAMGDYIQHSKELRDRYFSGNAISSADSCESFQNNTGKCLLESQSMDCVWKALGNKKSAGIQTHGARETVPLESHLCKEDCYINDTTTSQDQLKRNGSITRRSDVGIQSDLIGALTSNSQSGNFDIRDQYCSNFIEEDGFHRPSDANNVTRFLLKSIESSNEKEETYLDLTNQMIHTCDSMEVNDDTGVGSDSFVHTREEVGKIIIPSRKEDEDSNLVHHLSISYKNLKEGSVHSISSENFLPRRWDMYIEMPKLSKESVMEAMSKDKISVNHETDQITSKILDDTKLELPTRPNNQCSRQVQTLSDYYTEWDSLSCRTSVVGNDVYVNDCMKEINPDYGCTYKYNKEEEQFNAVHSESFHSDFYDVHSYSSSQSKSVFDLFLEGFRNAFSCFRPCSLFNLFKKSKSKINIPRHETPKSTRCANKQVRGYSSKIQIIQPLPPSQHFKAKTAHPPRQSYTLFIPESVMSCKSRKNKHPGSYTKHFKKSSDIEGAYFREYDENQEHSVFFSQWRSYPTTKSCNAIDKYGLFSAHPYLETNTICDGIGEGSSNLSSHRLSGEGDYFAKCKVRSFKSMVSHYREKFLRKSKYSVECIKNTSLTPGVQLCIEREISSETNIKKYESSGIECNKMFSRKLKKRDKQYMRNVKSANITQLATSEYSPTEKTSFNTTSKKIATQSESKRSCSKSTTTTKQYDLQDAMCKKMKQLQVRAHKYQTEQLILLNK